MSNQKLSGKVAWVSGATSGIGEATALMLAEQGAAVIVSGIESDKGPAVVKKIEAAGSKAIWTPCDVTVEAQVKESINAGVSALGRLDIVINNAGIVHIAELHEYSVEQWDQLMGVNVRSIFLSFKHAYEHLKKQQRSYVVNVASISSFVGQRGTPSYTTSKHAVLGLTRSIALDYAADGVRCNCVCPGITDTPLLRHHLGGEDADTDAALRERLKRVAMGVKLQPADIARSIVYFSCDDSFGITGQSLIIDCGYLASAEWEHPGHTAFMEPIK